jgi:hypothetical protein
MACAGTHELVKEFDRLSGSHLSELRTRTPLDAMIDDATGRYDAELAKFTAFVFTFVWLPMIGVTE